MRLFVAETGDGHWRELTDGTQQAVRVVASDLAQARRATARVHADGSAAAILDVTVAIAADFRSVRSALEVVDGVHYAGTVDGLAGLIADIQAAGVADGVTLVGVLPRQDVAALGREVLRRLALRGQPKAS